MCFSSTASIGAFSFGVFWLTLIIIKKMYIYAALYASIIIMQLFEYFGHLNLSGKSLFGLPISNEVIAYLIFGTIIVQPIIWNLVYMFKRNNKKYMKVASFLLPLFVLSSGYLFYQAIENNMMKISKLSPCTDSFCRMNWTFLRSLPLFSFLWVLFYGLMFNLPRLFASNNKNDNIHLSFVGLLLVLSLIYQIVVEKIGNLNILLSAFGSLWCILCVLLGPYIYFFA